MIHKVKNVQTFPTRQTFSAVVVGYINCHLLSKVIKKISHEKSSDLSLAEIKVA